MEKKLYTKLVETPHVIFEIVLVEQPDKLLLRLIRRTVEGNCPLDITFIPLQKEIAESVLKSIGDGFYDAAKKVK